MDDLISRHQSRISFVDVVVVDDGGIEGTFRIKRMANSGRIRNVRSRDKAP